ncbi:MAG: ketopantoate reductase family protein [Deltaproteobacteria bacterium]|nr:ketopantoate reductase family protein [Deltaproteobacteria bacterium]
MKPPIKSVYIIGAGAVGAAYAGLLFEMDKNNVAFIAAGERGERLRNQGVIVNGRHYPIPVFHPKEISSPADLVIVAVKHHHLDQAIGEMRKAVGDETTIISVMNGIDSEERIGSVYGMEKVLYAINVGIDALREGNRVTYRSQGKLLFGEARNPVWTERVRRVKEFIDRVGIVCEVPDDMIRTLWWKFMINVGINQVSAVLGGSYSVFQTSSRARELMASAMQEVIQLAAEAGVHLTDEDVGNWYAVLDSLNPSGKTSMLQDVEAGRKTEVEMFAGKVIELGRRYGVPTPVNERLFEEIRRLEGSSRRGP